MKRTVCQGSLLVVLVLVLLDWAHGFVSSSSSRFPCTYSRAPRHDETSASAAALNAKNKNGDEMFDEYFAEQIARDVEKSLDVPFFIPTPVVTYLVEQAVRRLSTDLSPETKEQLQELAQAAATPSKNDDFLQHEIDQLADRIAKDINPKVDVPVLDEKQEYVLLQQILRVALQSMTSENKINWDANIQASREILGGPESRLALAKSIDTKIDFPLPLDDAQRLALISTALDGSADLLTKLLPPELLESLKGESPEGILKMKEYLIDAVNVKVDLVGINEEQERQLIETMVNLLIDEYIDDTEAENLLLTQEEQQAWLEEKKLALEREKTFSQRRFEREQVSLDRKLDRIEARLKEMRRSRSFLRRLLGFLRRKK